MSFERANGVSSFSITFLQRDGVEKVVESSAGGGSLMELARDNGVDGILGDCGGGCACGTCHVYVRASEEGQLAPREDLEEMTLDMLGELYLPNSRLCCQIQLGPELDGLRLEVAPEP